MIDKIQANVEEVKKKHSAILSAPQSDESKFYRNTCMLWDYKKVDVPPDAQLDHLLEAFAVRADDHKQGQRHG